MASIKLENVDKWYAKGQPALRDVNLEVFDGELLVLVGPSGCGKSTLLRIVAGLERPTAGRVLLGGSDVTDLPPQARDLAMVFQNYALYPHKSVRENLAFGLQMRRVRPEIIEQMVTRVARTLGLDPLLNRKPSELSGGQRQRVALGRAIVRDPRAFLLDEPLSNLDAQLRIQTRSELARIHRRLGATMLYVTHDQEEAMTLGDRVVVLREGILQQVAPPLEIYQRPVNMFVGSFIGSPSMNFIHSELTVESCVEVTFGSFRLQLDPAEAFPSGKQDVWLGVRPRDIEIVEPAQADIITRVDVVQPLGSDLLVEGQWPETTDDFHVTAIVPAETNVRVEDKVGLRFRRNRLHIFDMATGKRLN